MPGDGEAVGCETLRPWGRRIEQIFSSTEAWPLIIQRQVNETALICRYEVLKKHPAERIFGLWQKKFRTGDFSAHFLLTKTTPLGQVGFPNDVGL
jgi:hypothetical protein